MGDWGPVEHPTGRNNEHAPGGQDGGVCQSDEASTHRNPRHDENYNATDGRHNRADHQGWTPVDPNSGATSDTDFGDGRGKFEDGPGVWRQT